MLRTAILEGFTLRTPPEKVRLRQRRQGDDCPLVRPVTGKNRHQIRIWLPETPTRPAVSVNCGLYESELRANAVRDALLGKLGVSQPLEKGWQKKLTPLRIWVEGIKPLIAAGRIPDKVLPLWVKPTKGGQFFGKVRVNGVVLTGETCATPEAAYEAVEALVTKNFTGRAKRGKTTLYLTWGG